MKQGSGKASHPLFHQKYGNRQAAGRGGDGADAAATVLCDPVFRYQGAVLLFPKGRTPGGVDDCGGLSKGRDSAPVQPGVFADAAGEDGTRAEELILQAADGYYIYAVLPAIRVIPGSS